jgi:hypothetical protein
MSSRIESLAETVAIAWGECCSRIEYRARHGSDSGLWRALDDLLCWRLDHSSGEIKRPAAILEIEKTAERMANAKSAQSSVEKPAAPDSVFVLWDANEGEFCGDPYACAVNGLVVAEYHRRTPEQDRAVIRCSLDALQAWNNWDGHSAEGFWPLANRIRDLRAALTAAGYLEEDSHV